MFLRPPRRTPSSLLSLTRRPQQQRATSSSVPLPSRYTSMREYVYEEDLGELRMPLIPLRCWNVCFLKAR